MAVLTGALTAADVLKEFDPKGRPVKVVELLKQSCSLYDDGRWKMCNNVEKNLSAVTTSLPGSTKRKDNQGVAPSHGTTAQLTDDTTAMVQYSTIDCAVADRNGNSFEFRARQARKHMMGLNNDVQEELVYGNLLLDPAGINGAMARYDSIGQNVLDAGGLGSTNMSVLMFQWCDDVSLLYPENSVLGVAHEDKGKQTIPTALNGPVPELIDVYMDRWEQKFGLDVDDWRKIVRGANIDVTQLGTGGAADLQGLLTDMYHCLPDHEEGTICIYGNRTFMKYMDKQFQDRAEFFGVEDVAGKKIRTWRNCRLRTLDCLLETEDQVV